MRRYKVFDIFWETDGHDWRMLDLPQEASVTLEEEDDPDEALPQRLSELYGGWEVNSLEYESA